MSLLNILFSATFVSSLIYFFGLVMARLLGP